MRDLVLYQPNVDVSVLRDALNTGISREGVTPLKPQQALSDLRAAVEDILRAERAPALPDERTVQLYWYAAMPIYTLGDIAKGTDEDGEPIRSPFWLYAPLVAAAVINPHAESGTIYTLRDAIGFNSFMKEMAVGSHTYVVLKLVKERPEWLEKIKVINLVPCLTVNTLPEYQDWTQRASRTKVERLLPVGLTLGY